MLFDSLKKLFLEQITPLVKEWYNNYKDRAAELKDDIMTADNDPQYMEHRVMWCFNCNGKRQLTAIQGSSLIVCDSCHGHNWEHYTNKYWIPYEITVTNTKTGEKKVIYNGRAS